MIVGIDLGTTNSLIGVWRDGRTELIPNALGSFLTPSAIYIDHEGMVHVGMAARDRLSTQPARSIAAFKRYMGTNRKFTLGEQQFGAVELSALVLRSLKQDAERYLQCSIEEAIVTVPAYFNDFQRKATKAAAEMAGLRVERLLNEPTAAALAYGIHEEAGDRKILVLDLGGGTFDVSLLEMFEGIMEVRASAGDNCLGGEDFADLIIDAFITEVGAAAGIPPRSQAADIHGALRHQAELAKRQLSDTESFVIELVFNDKQLSWTLTRERFESLSEPSLNRVRSPIERAIRDAGLAPQDVTHVVLAGGATRMPMIRRMAARLFGQIPIAKINPDEVVAHGAAIQAALKMQDAALDDVVMTDVAPFTLGINTSRKLGDYNRISGLYAPIIERNTVIPASRSKRFSTTKDGQQSVRVAVFQGEARMVADNIYLGELIVPVPPAPAGHEGIEVRFTYDTSGLLEVETNNSLGQVNRLVIEGNSGIFTDAEIAARLQALAAIKIHPRDQAENQAVLARAERLYEERLGRERDVVGESTDAFRVILELQDPQEIASHRTRFSSWLDSVDTRFFV